MTPDDVLWGPADGGEAPSRFRRDAVLLSDFSAAATIVLVTLVGLALALAVREPWA